MIEAFVCADDVLNTYAMELISFPVVELRERRYLSRAVSSLVAAFMSEFFDVKVRPGVTRLFTKLCTAMMVLLYVA